ncbi:hypothetical protein BC830DRAFT_1137227 [Chytriomyces sp. MP71]|nr:hypothetical protein BC830DRAFT_1137227 [Chytriomyces sp. MP71]
MGTSAFPMVIARAHMKIKSASLLLIAWMSYGQIDGGSVLCGFLLSCVDGDGLVGLFKKHLSNESGRFSSLEDVLVSCLLT